ncbi:hypothetical protein HHI36_014866 [Cryptolaemus montrouzieri]|uniref:Uncharacterized protein n=1 Tax=Cryptolaemus montrouzieri TaxID=559131 RepID=A0ABD2N4A9_9CUCU
MLEAKRKKNLEKPAGKINGNKKKNMETRKEATKKRGFENTMKQNEQSDERCIICNEFENNELWFSYSSCGQ